MGVSDRTDVQILKASYALRNRVGAGPLDLAVIQRCQDVIENNDVDFVPLARQFLEQLVQGLRMAQDPALSVSQRMDRLTRPVMELKANARTFKYELVTSLAGLMLTFLESLQTIDSDVVELVSVHHKTLDMIVERRMTGSGGPYGTLLQQELRDACNRYLNRKRTPSGP